VQAQAQPQLASTSWNINASGPLGYLAGSKPIASMSLRNFTSASAAGPFKTPKQAR
jgi:hypothetical protein